MSRLIACTALACMFYVHLDIKNYEHYDDHMRTTLTLDDDVADFLKEQSQLHNKPFKQVVNEVLRRGMAPGSKRSKSPKFRIVPNRSNLFPGVDPRKLNQLNDQLEAEDFAGEGST